MATLSKRATPRQAMVMRMIEGACRNAAHAHPGRSLDDRMVRSIAKRATGTLTSQWGLVLAAPRTRSDGDPSHGPLGKASDSGELWNLSRRGVASSRNLQPRGASQVAWRTPLHCLKLAIGAECGIARRVGMKERESALKDVLRLLSRVMLADQPPRRGERLTFAALAAELAERERMMEGE